VKRLTLKQAALDAARNYIALKFSTAIDSLPPPDRDDFLMGFTMALCSVGALHKVEQYPAYQLATDIICEMPVEMGGEPDEVVN